jgi:hypothetical protein
VKSFAELVRLRGLAEQGKSLDRSRLAGRVQLLHEVIARGLTSLLKEGRVSRPAD